MKHGETRRSKRKHEETQGNTMKHDETRWNRKKQGEIERNTKKHKGTQRNTIKHNSKIRESIDWKPVETIRKSVNVSDNQRVWEEPRAIYHFKSMIYAKNRPKFPSSWPPLRGRKLANQQWISKISGPAGRSRGSAALELFVIVCNYPPSRRRFLAQSAFVIICNCL